MSRIFLLLAAACTLLVCAGCEPPRFYKCAGVVTRDGNPVPFLQISFAPHIIDSVRMPIAVSDENGHFEMYSVRNAGVPPGSYTVYVEDPSEADGRQTSTEPDYLYVIDRYSPFKSDYKYVADSDRIDFELKLDTKPYTGPEQPEEESEAAEPKDAAVEGEEQKEIAPESEKPPGEAAASEDPVSEQPVGKEPVKDETSSSGEAAVDAEVN